MNQLYNRVRNAYELLRAPDRQPKCYDMTEQERSAAIVRLTQNNNPSVKQQESQNER